MAKPRAFGFAPRSARGERGRPSPTTVDREDPMRMIHRWLAALLTLAPTVAMAGGYDTPILYSARHIGMGGTGVSWVSDPTALYMNPAGLGHTEFITLHVNISPIIATLDGVPEADHEVTAGPTVLPAFLVGGAFRVWKHLTFGIGAYPVASASGAYEYTTKLDPKPAKDETTIRFIEISPALAFNYKDIITLGVGYRITLAQLTRLKNREGDAHPLFDFDTKGWDFEGFRVGAQYRPTKNVSLGINYRHKITPTAKADSGWLYGFAELRDINFPLTLPSRLSFGGRVDVPVPVGNIGVSLDAEYAWQSQNDVSHITADLKAAPTADFAPTAVDSYFNWKDAWTIRWGTELAIPDSSLGGTWAARLGFVWDQETANRSYASAFGTPPADTQSYTIGGGYKATHWEVNLAYAYRNGSTTITKEESTAPIREKSCSTCSFAGLHEITLHALYVDFSWYFDLPSSLASWSPTVED